MQGDVAAAANLNFENVQELRMAVGVEWRRHQSRSLEYSGDSSELSSPPPPADPAPRGPSEQSSFRGCGPGYVYER